MSKKSSNIWLGVGLGGAILGVGGTVAALAIAHNKAKKQNKTTSQYLKDKVLGMKKNAKKCTNCGNIPCDCITDEDYDELLEELDDLNDDDLDEMFEEEGDSHISDDISIDQIAKERDDWKQKYLDLAASLSKADEN